MIVTDVRCPYCSLLLFKMRVIPRNQEMLMLLEDAEDSVEIKCERCRRVISKRIASEWKKVLENPVEGQAETLQRRLSDGGLRRS